MQLSTYSDYALRLLMKLAVEPDRLITIREVAGSYRISANHLMKVAQELSRLGYIEAVRGRGGGVRLARPAAEICIGEVVRGTEGNLILVECFDATRNSCILTGACQLRHLLVEALEGFFGVLDRYTLSDLTKNRADLLALLAPKP